MTYSKKEIIDIIENVIDNKPVLREWDDLVSVHHEDQCTSMISNRLLEIQNLYSDLDKGIFINEEGIKNLKEFIKDIDKYYNTNK